LTGRSGTTVSWFTTPLLEALAVFGTAATKKIISRAAWGGIIFFVAAVLAI
jgi:hypothetical protein